MIWELQKEGVVDTKKAGVYKGRKPLQNAKSLAEPQKRVGEGKKHTPGSRL